MHDAHRAAIPQLQDHRILRSKPRGKRMPVWIASALLACCRMTIAPARADVLHLDGNYSPTTGGPATITDDVILDGPVILTPVFVFSTSEYTFTGTVSGPGGFVIDNGGILELNGNNSFAGGITFTCPTAFYPLLIASKPGALGSGNLLFNLSQSSGALVQFQMQPGPTTSFTQPLVINSSGSISATTVFLGAAGSTLGQQVSVPSLSVTGSAAVSFGQTPGGSPDLAWSVGPLQLNGGTLALTSSTTIYSTNLNGTAFSTSFLAYSPTISLGPISESASSAIVVSQNTQVHLTSTGDYSGGTTINGAQLFADVPHALGTGPVTLTNNGTLTLNATDAASQPLSGGYIEYNANGAASGHNISNTILSIGPAVTSFSDGAATDTFSNVAGLKGNSTELAMFDRGIGGGTANVSFAPLATIENTDGTLPTVHNLGTNADLALGLATQGSSSLPVTVGTGTPWGGFISGNYSGQITANSSFLVESTTFANGSASSFTIVAPGPSAPITVTLDNVTFGASTPSFFGVAQFTNGSPGSVTLSAPNALGGGGGTAPVPMEVTAQSNLVVTDPLAINGPVHLDAGSTLTIQGPGLAGTGSISRDAGAVTINLANPQALDNDGQVQFVQAGDTFALGASNLDGLDALGTGKNFEIVGTTFTQNISLRLDAASMFSSGSAILAPTAGSNFTVFIGPDGGTLIGGPLLRVSAPISAQGVVTILSPAGTSKVVLDNPGNQFQSTINAVSGILEATSPGALGGATINAMGASLFFDSSAPNLPVEYDNPIIITGNLAEPVQGMNTGSLTLGNVTLAGGTLTFSTLTLASLTISTLTLTGTGAFSTASIGTLHIGALTQNGTTSTAANLSTGQANPNIQFHITGPVSLTGPISIGASVYLDGTVFSSNSALTVGTEPNALLGGTGTIHRSVAFGSFGGTISPGDLSTAINPQSLPGALSVDSLSLTNASLTWNLGQPGVIGGPFNDLVAVSGDLTLPSQLLMTVIPGSGFAPGVYTLFAYGGTLFEPQGGTSLSPPSGIGGYSASLDLSTPGQVNLDITGVPEPASLCPLLLAAATLLRRRRSRPRSYAERRTAGIRHLFPRFL